jgi:hypothetical protein
VEKLHLCPPPDHPVAVAVPAEAPHRWHHSGNHYRSHSHTTRYGMRNNLLLLIGMYMYMYVHCVHVVSRVYNTMCSAREPFEETLEEILAIFAGSFFIVILFRVYEFSPFLSILDNSPHFIYLLLDH